MGAAGCALSGDQLVDAVRAALSPLPDCDSGLAVVLATSGVPPAFALLSSGDVTIDGATVRAATSAASSAASRLGGAFTLLVPAGTVAYRVEVVDAAARQAGALAVLEGTLAAVRPTAEPPWVLLLGFARDPATPPTDAGDFVRFWAAVRDWLVDGAIGDPPDPPDPGA